jgi:hypothetical protein
MSKQIIFLGQTANDRTGDPLRVAFEKVNSNFDELYARTGDDIQIPALAGNNGKVLTTNGTTLSWSPATTNKLVNDSNELVFDANGILNFPNNNGQIGQLESAYTGLEFRTGAGADWIGISYGEINDNNTSYFYFDKDGNNYLTANHRAHLQIKNPAHDGHVKWLFDSDGKLTLPSTNIITAALSQQVGTIITDIEAWNWHNGTGNPYAWNQWNPAFLSLYNIGYSIIGWSFYSDADPSNVVTITARNPDISELTFSGDLGSPPYVAQSPDYVSFHGNPVVIQTNGPQFQADWTFGEDGSLTLPNGSTQTSTGSINCQPGVDTVVFTSSQAGIQTIKLILKVEGVEAAAQDADTQSCEMIIAKGFRGPTVAASVYGIVYTSVEPLATFTADWNPTLLRVEVTCQPTSLTYSVDVKSFATEITTSD